MIPSAGEAVTVVAGWALEETCPCVGEARQSSGLAFLFFFVD